MGGGPAEPIQLALYSWNNIQSLKEWKKRNETQKNENDICLSIRWFIRQDKSRCDFVVAGKGESLWIKEIIEFFVSLVCVCSLVYCVIRGLETLTIISSPKANFLIWCHITWNTIKIWQKMRGIGRDGTCNIIFVHATMWSLSE